MGLLWMYSSGLYGQAWAGLWIKYCYSYTKWHHSHPNALNVDTPSRSWDSTPHPPSIPGKPQYQAHVAQTRKNLVMKPQKGLPMEVSKSMSEHQFHSALKAFFQRLLLTWENANNMTSFKYWEERNSNININILSPGDKAMHSFNFFLHVYLVFSCFLQRLSATL